MIVRENLWKDPCRCEFCNGDGYVTGPDVDLTTQCDRCNGTGRVGLGLIAVTTNAVLKRDGSLVMGCGAALEATQHIPGVEYECGRMVDGRLTYGFEVVREPTADKVGFGIFQVKNHYRDAASLELVRTSVEQLAEWARANPDVNVRLNYPGIGHGRLKRADVEPLLEVLPDNVTVCYK